MAQFVLFATQRVMDIPRGAVHAAQTAVAVATVHHLTQTMMAADGGTIVLIRHRDRGAFHSAYLLNRGEWS